MSKKKGQHARRLRRWAVDWDAGIRDPRSSRGRRHTHLGLLNLLVAGFATGAATLRGIEDVAEDVGSTARRVLGVLRRVSDTALYLLLQRQSPAGFRETLLTQVKTQWRRKSISHDLFPLGVLAIDGKSVWTSNRKGFDGAKEAVQGPHLTMSLSMLNAVLVSSSARPCVDLELIAAKSGESPAFRNLLPRIAEGFPHFEVVTADAGLLCRENANLVHALGKHYVLALKPNQARLHCAATRSFESLVGTERVVRQERRNGTRITRTLQTLVVADSDGLGLDGLQEFWRLSQVTEVPGVPPVEEVRFFVSSLPARRLSPTQKLDLVRLHWGIENGRHWTLDVAFQEDARQPCQTSLSAVEVTCWLRALAYNLVAIRRARGPKKDSRPLPWRRVMQRFRDQLVVGMEVPDAHLV